MTEQTPPGWTTTHGSGQSAAADPTEPKGTPMTSTTAAAQPEMRLTRTGFPVETCGRCAGAGNIPAFSNVFGGQCFGCSGSGVVYPKGKPAKLAAEWERTRRNAVDATAAVIVKIAADGTRTVEPGVKAGDVIRQYKDAPWRTVVDVRPTRRVVGSCTAGTRLVNLTLETLVTFDDGATERCTGILWKRQMSPELLAVRDRLAEEARTAYARTLARRARRA